MQEQIFDQKLNIMTNKTMTTKTIAKQSKSEDKNTSFGFPKAHLDATDLERLNNIPVQWVKTEGQLYDLIDVIDSIDRVALDTEFIRRTTYFPILALIQVNTGDKIYLVDAPRLDLTEFWHALQEVPEMIWYACGEDLGLFYLLADCEPLKNVIDVQIGVAYLTADLQASYARCIEEVLGVALSKSESKSDWLVRPLSEEQEAYAADDVRYLFALHDVVTEQLQQKNILQYAQEDYQDYALQLFELHHLEDDQFYLDSIARNYTHEQITVLQALTTWREKLARAMNRPRSFIISKQAMREIISEMPESIKGLARTTIDRGSLRRYGDEIIRVIKTAKSLPISERPPMPPPPYSSGDKPFSQALEEASQLYAKELGIPEMLLFRNRWLQPLLQVVATEDMTHFPKDITGYRHEWVINTILPILQPYRSHIRLMMGLDDKPITKKR